MSTKTAVQRFGFGLTKRTFVVVVTNRSNQRRRVVAVKENAELGFETQHETSSGYGTFIAQKEKIGFRFEALNRQQPALLRFSVLSTCPSAPSPLSFCVPHFLLEKLWFGNSWAHGQPTGFLSMANRST